MNPSYSGWVVYFNMNMLKYILNYAIATDLEVNSALFLFGSASEKLLMCTLR
jgi:hypothetical protein